MLWKKKDLNYYYEKFKNENFTDYKNEEIYKIYSELKEKYLKVIKNMTKLEALEYIHYEKLKLDLKLGKHESSYVKSSDAILAALTAGLFTVYIDKIDAFGKTSTTFISSMSFFVFLTALGIALIPDIKRLVKKDSIAYIALKVIEEIEFDIESGKIIFDEEINKDSSEKVESKTPKFSLNLKIENKNSKYALHTNGLEGLFMMCKAYQKVKGKKRI